MIRKNLHGLQILKGTEKFSKGTEGFPVTGNAGNRHMADPEGNPVRVQISGELKDIFVGMPSQVFVGFIVDMLNVQHDQIRGL